MFYHEDASLIQNQEKEAVTVDEKLIFVTLYFLFISLTQFNLQILFRRIVVATLCLSGISKCCQSKSSFRVLHLSVERRTGLFRLCFFLFLFFFLFPNDSEDIPCDTNAASG